MGVCRASSRDARHLSRKTVATHLLPWADSREELLAKFPYPPEPTAGLPRSGFRVLYLNSKRIRPQLPNQISSTSGQQAYPSIPRRKQKREADQALADALHTVDGHTPISGSGGLAEHVRAKSRAGRSCTPAPPPLVPTTHSLRPII
ncbi:hypothetical protein EDB19DRAFT_1907417 [Suillus lakei]|nr:hypothetical protein EDB19DRAFT_1907417 [Suillus lakei]